MKQKITIGIFFLVLALGTMASCSNNQAHEDSYLDKYEALLSKKPEQAYKALLAIHPSIETQPASIQMYYQILLCRAQDLNYITHTNDSIMKDVVHYYQNCQDNDKLMQAYYCMGCINRDMHDSPKALSYLRKAAEMSMGSDNYAIVGKIYTQMAYIQNMGYNEKSAMKSYNKALYYFKKAHDASSVSNIYMNIAHIYHLLHNDKKSFATLKIAEGNCPPDDYHTLSNILLSKAELLIDADEPEKTVAIYNYAKSKLPRNIINQFGYYMLKGNIDMYHHQYSSAIDNFIKASQDNNNEHKFSVYLYMSSLYHENLCNDGEALKYANMALDLSDTIRYEAVDKEIARMQYLYNYEKSQKENALLSIDNLKSRQKLGFATIILMLLAVMYLLLLMKYRKKKVQLERTIIEKENICNKSFERIKQNEEEIIRLKNINDDISQIKINALQNNNKRIKEDIEEQNNRWNSLRTFEAYHKLHSLTASGALDSGRADIDSLLEKLTEYIDLLFDEYGKRLRAFYPSINRTQIKICYLLKADFSLSEIAIIIPCTKQAVTNARNIIRKKCFDSTATLAEVDDFIKSL